MNGDPVPQSSFDFNDNSCVGMSSRIFGEVCTTPTLVISPEQHNDTLRRAMPFEGSEYS